MIRRLRGHAITAAALGGYLALTLAFTYPLLTHFTRAIPGDGFDGWQNYWNLWWVKVALLEQHTTPFFTDLLYYPTGVGLLFHTLNPFNGLLTLPVQLATDLFRAYNGVVLFSFAVGGLGAYLLARQSLGPRGGRWAAFAAGLIFTFAPVHIAHLLGHMQVISLEWIPFFVLYLLRATHRADGMRLSTPRLTAGAARSVRHNVILAAFFLILVALCDWYYVLYCLIFTALVAAWAAGHSLRAWLRQRTAPPPPHAPKLYQTILVLAAIWLIWAVAFSPLLLPMVGEAGRYRFMVPDPTQSRALSADLLAFITPQGFHPLWGLWAQARSQVFTSSRSEYTVFAGFTALALAVLGLWVGWRHHGLERQMRISRRVKRHFPEPTRSETGQSESDDERQRRTLAPEHTQAHSAIRNLQSAFPALWPLALLTFLILSLGPVLHIGGQTALLPGGGEIPLPYGGLVRSVPFMDITRSVSRYDVMVMLVIAVLAARGLAWLRHRGRAGRWGAVAAVGLILFEFLPAPYPLSQPDTPAWYETLAADPRPGAVLNLPMNWDRPGYLLYQTVHHKPLTAAYISREDPRTLVERAPVLQHFRHLGPDIIAFDLAAQGQAVLADLGVRWVVLDRYKMPGGQERAYTEATARTIFGAHSPSHADDRLTVYEVAAAPAAPYLILGDGWHAHNRQRASRIFIGSATIVIRAPAAGSATLRVTLASGSGALAAAEDRDGFSLPLNLQPGDNIISVRSQQPGAAVEVTRLTLAPAN